MLLAESGDYQTNKMKKLNVVRKADVILYCPKKTCPPTKDMWAKHNALIASRRESIIAYQAQQQTIQPQPAKGFGLGLVALLGLLLHV